jgi:hypothetical protein
MTSTAPTPTAPTRRPSVANLLYMLHDARWLTCTGGIVTTGVGIAVLLQVWQVFPFRFDGSSFDWSLLVRFALIVAILGSAVAVIVQMCAVHSAR